MKLPNIKTREMVVELDYVNGLLGLQLSGKEVKGLLEKMRYGVELQKEVVKVCIPPYRTDVLHPIDVVEDVAIAYGYDRFQPELPPLPTIGSRIGRGKLCDDLRQILVGYGFQEVMTLTMTNQNEQFGLMNLPVEEAVEAENPVSMEHSIARVWLLPSLMNVLAKNKNREYPQKILEIGLCIDKNGGTLHRLAATIAKSKTDFAEIKSVATGLLGNLGLNDDPNAYDHPSFISGRCAKNQYGFYGEVGAGVLNNFGLEVPVTAFEFDIDKITTAIAGGGRALH
ncbi:hypothetical protein ACFLRC_01520 [Candidatus Altiarchaeota archaeon]